MTFDEFVQFHRARMVDAEGGLQSGVNLKRAGTALLASQYGINDLLWIPQTPPYVLASGHANPKHIDGSETTDTNHALESIPTYDAIPAAVADICKDGNAALRLRDMGLVVESKAVARLNRTIRGCVHALTLFHLWNGDDVCKLRFKTLKRKDGPVFVPKPKWRHHAQYRPYWRLAWEMHGDGTRHADCIAYLQALCVAFEQHAGKPHVGSVVHTAICNLQDQGSI